MHHTFTCRHIVYGSHLACLYSKVKRSEVKLQLLQSFCGTLDFVLDTPGPGRDGTRRNIPALTPIVVINQPLSASSIYMYYDQWHLPCSIYVPASLFAQPLSKYSLVYLSVWHPPLHTPYISSPNHCLLFAAHAHATAACFAVVPRL